MALEGIVENGPEPEQQSSHFQPSWTSPSTQVIVGGRNCWLSPVVIIEQVLSFCVWNQKWWECWLVWLGDIPCHSFRGSTWWELFLCSIVSLGKQQTCPLWKKDGAKIIKTCNSLICLFQGMKSHSNLWGEAGSRSLIFLTISLKRKQCDTSRSRKQALSICETIK